jgi:hypothetical protein
MALESRMELKMAFGTSKRSSVLKKKPPLRPPRKSDLEESKRPKSIIAVLDRIKGKKPQISTRKCDDPDFPLTQDEKNFVDQYVIDYSARGAFVRAGIELATAKANVDTTAHRLLKKANIQRAVRMAEVQDGERYRWLKDRCIQEAAKIAFQDAKEIYDIDIDGVPKLKPISQIDGKLIKSLYARSRKKKDDNGVTMTDLDLKIDTWDKDKALSMLGRWLGLDKLDVTSGGKPIEAPTATILILDRNGKEAENVNMRL